MKKQQHSDTSSMNKKRIEICLISARGLPRPTLLKHHYYAVGWVDPTNRYCTNIDISGNANPVWKTKFCTVIDAELDSDTLGAVLNVEVYSREPVFLTEKLQGTASINLREFLRKYSKNSERCERGNDSNENVGSFQLRNKKKNDKPVGFIDVSVKVSEDVQGTSSYSFLGDDEGFNLQDNSSITLPTGPTQAYTGGRVEPPFHPSQNLPPPTAHPYTHPVSNPRNYSHPPTGRPNYPPATGPSYYPPQMPPPLSYNGAYVPSFLPQGNSQSTSYMNMPSSSGAGRGAGPAFGVGLGAGALAAGAVIYGSDIMSGFELPSVMSNPSLSVSIDPPF